MDVQYKEREHSFGHSMLPIYQLLVALTSRCPEEILGVAAAPRGVLTRVADPAADYPDPDPTHEKSPKPGPSFGQQPT